MIKTAIQSISLIGRHDGLLPDDLFDLHETENLLLSIVKDIK